jgi:hypothetical protein
MPMFLVAAPSSSSGTAERPCGQTEKVFQSPPYSMRIKRVSMCHARSGRIAPLSRRRATDWAMFFQPGCTPEAGLR